MEEQEIDIKNAKLLGGIGSILLIFLPFVGYILVVLSAKQFSDVFKKSSIFKDFLVATIINVVSTFIIPLIYIPIYFVLSMRTPMGNPGEFPAGFAFPAIMIVVFLLSWILNSIASYFTRRGFLALAEGTNRGDFATAGDLIFYGALAAIILVGGLIYLVGAIYAIIAFFGLPDKLVLESSGQEYQEI